MRPLTASIDVSASAEDVFQHLVEGELVREWMPGVASTEDLTEGGPRIGERSRTTFEMNGRRWTAEAEITRYEPGRLVESLTTRPHLASQRFELVETGGSTKIHLAVEMHFSRPRWIHEFQARLGEDFYQNLLDLSLDRLKRRVEDPATVLRPVDSTPGFARFYFKTRAMSLAIGIPIGLALLQVT